MPSKTWGGGYNVPGSLGQKLTKKTEARERVKRDGIGARFGTKKKAIMESIAKKGRRQGKIPEGKDT